MPLTRPQAGILGNSQITAVPTALNIGVPIVESSQIISASYTISTGSNASSVGPITIASGVVLTVPVGSVWKVI
jgi:hypothetical protein